MVFAGSGGAGAMTAGAVLLRAAAQAGYYGLMTQLFGPQVRGGEAAALVQVSTEPISCQPDRFDLLSRSIGEKIPFPRSASSPKRLCIHWRLQIRRWRIFAVAR